MRAMNNGRHKVWKSLAGIALCATLGGCALSPEFMSSSPDRDVCERYGIFSRNTTFSELTRQYQSELERRNLLSQNEKDLAAKKQIQRGMSLCGLYASWGKPDRENRSVGSWGTHIQHIYHAGLRYVRPTYVYTENGRVTAWQD